MKLNERSELYRQLARAESLESEITDRGLTLQTMDCREHGESPHYVSTDGASVCTACLSLSRVMVEVGRRGGKIGGKAKTPRKLRAFKAAAAKRWKKRR